MSFFSSRRVKMQIAGCGIVYVRAIPRRIPIAALRRMVDRLNRFQSVAGRRLPLDPKAEFVWFYLATSPGKTNRTRQNETRRKNEPRRIKMNRTLQDESDASRRIWLAACARWLPACARKSGEMRTNSHGFTPNPLS